MKWVVSWRITQQSLITLMPHTEFDLNRTISQGEGEFFVFKVKILGRSLSPPYRGGIPK